MFAVSSVCAELKSAPERGSWHDKNKTETQ